MLYTILMGIPPRLNLRGEANMQRWTRRFLTVAVTLGVAILLQGGSAFAQAKAQAKDPVIGTWILDLSQSKFEGADAPGKRTMVFTAVGDAIKHTTSTIPAGVPGIVVAGGNEYTAKTDGVDVHITGSFLDTVSLKRIDARTVERTGKVMGKVVETMTRTLSADGKTLTVTTKGTNPTTETDYSSVQVFTRQP